MRREECAIRGGECKCGEGGVFKGKVCDCEFGRKLYGKDQRVLGCVSECKDGSAFVEECSAKQICVSPGKDRDGEGQRRDVERMCDVGGGMSECVNVQLDLRHCGECNAKCFDGQSGVEDKCVDKDRCGDKGARCAEGAVCAKDLRIEWDRGWWRWKYDECLGWERLSSECHCWCGQLSQKNVCEVGKDCVRDYCDSGKCGSSSMRLLEERDNGRYYVGCVEKCNGGGCAKGAVCVRDRNGREECRCVVSGWSYDIAQECSEKGHYCDGLQCLEDKCREKNCGG